MLIAGEKWACEACVRGHRVSNCQHSDRPLQHINKKGRPVSQCQHCRTLRKSRSAHVRCDCSSEKAHNKEVGSSESPIQENCLCNHGGRCKCTHKKEPPLNSVKKPESEETPLLEKRRARAHTTGLEHNLTIMTNGYRKSTHRHNNTAQKYGSPYPTPRTQSLRGLSPSHHLTHAKTYPGYLAKIDCSESINREASLRAQADQYVSDSKCPSSDPSPTSGSTANKEVFSSPMSSMNLFAAGELNWPQSLDGLSSTPDIDSPKFSNGVPSTSIDWSHYEGLNFNNEKHALKSFSQPPSYSGFDFVGLDQPPLISTPTSGDLSEVDELGPFSDGSSGVSILPTQNYGSEQDLSDFTGDIDGHKMDNVSPFTYLPKAQILSINGHLDDLDAFLKYSNTLSSLTNNIPLSTDDGKNPSQETSQFNESNFGIFSVEDENETYWLSNFSPNSALVGTSASQSGLLDNFWVQ